MDIEESRNHSRSHCPTMLLGMTWMAEVKVENVGLAKFECKELALTES